MPSRQENLRLWDRDYIWREDGDEWSDQAGFCGQPYQAWKGSIVKHLILPNVRKGSTVLELAPGHGRWSGFLAGAASRAILVDMSPECIRHCRQRLSGFRNISYFVNDGSSLGMVRGSSIDFIFSFDSFVHIEKKETASYLAEFGRVLKKGGRALIHHPGRSDLLLPLGFLCRLGAPGRVLYALLSMRRLRSHDGLRANVSRELFADLAERSGLTVVSQSDSWGMRGEFNVRLFRDCISVLEKRS